MAHDGALATVTWTRTSDALGERPRPQGLAGGTGVPGPSLCGGTCRGIARGVEGLQTERELLIVGATGGPARVHCMLFSTSACVRNFPKVKNEEKKGSPIGLLERTWHLDGQY